MAQITNAGGGKPLINGTSYSITGGKTKVAGTDYEIRFKKKYSISTSNTGYTTYNPYTDSPEQAYANVRVNGVLHANCAYEGDTIIVAGGWSGVQGNMFMDLSAPIYLNGLKVADGTYTFFASGNISVRGSQVAIQILGQCPWRVDITM